MELTSIIYLLNSILKTHTRGTKMFRKHHLHKRLAKLNTDMELGLFETYLMLYSTSI